MTKKNRQVGRQNLKLIKDTPTDNFVSRDFDLYRRVDYPLFSFRYLQATSFTDCRRHIFFIDFINRLTKLSQLGWEEIGTSRRHSFGFEKIPRDIIKPGIPSNITPDVQLLAFRATGDNHPFIGFREGKIFHILFIESAFGDIYNH